MLDAVRNADDNGVGQLNRHAAQVPRHVLCEVVELQAGIGVEGLFDRCSGPPPEPAPSGRGACPQNPGEKGLGWVA